MMSSVSKTDTAAADGGVVFLGFGSNLGDRAATLREALERTATFVDIDVCSDIYETEPFGFTDQPKFLNLVLRGRTTLEPVDLLHAVKDVERQLGRTRSVRLGPRIIDIDVLLYGGIAMDDDIVLPHPGLLERAFVLQPLVDIEPDLRHPVTGVLLRDVLVRLTDDVHAMRRLGPVPGHLPLSRSDDDATR